MFENPFASRSYLVIDDFAEMRNMIKGLLRTLGATDIDVARDGKEAISKMERNGFDIVLCDYHLGSGKDGQQVLEEAKRRRLINITTVFVMITAENTRDMVMAAVEYEPDSYLSKPFTKDLLRTRLEKLLQRKADLSQVNNALDKKDYESATTLLDERIAKKPKNLADLIRLKADVCYMSGDLDTACEIFERVLANRDVPWAMVGLGKVLYARKQFVDAKETFQQLVSSYKTLTPAYDWLAKAQRAMGFPDDAQETLAAAVTLSPKAIQRQQALGELAIQNKDFELAEKSFGAAVKLGTHSIYNHPSLYAGLAKAKSAAGKHTEAVEVIDRIKDNFSDEAASFYAAAAEGTVKQNQGDSQGALACLEKAEQLHEKMGHRAPPSIALELARFTSQVGQKDRAEQILRTVIQNNHDDDEFLVDATDTCREAEISDNAEGLVHKIRQDVIEMNNRGARLIANHEFDEAIALFEKAAEGMPSNKVINLNAARALIMKMEQRGADMEAIGRVRRYIERSRQAAPDDKQLVKVMKRYQRLMAAH